MESIFNDKLPIYIQIVAYIKKKIVTSKLKCGDKLPSVRELSSQLKVNPNTLQRAYQELEREGITCTQRGMGTFVVEDINMINTLKKEMAKEIIDSFISGMKNLGFDNKEIMQIVDESLKNSNGSEEVE